MGLEFRVLGPLEALVDGLPARLGGPRQRALLAILLVHANEVVPVARLVDEVWGDDPPVTADNVLQTYVSQLRKVLGREAIATRGRGYVVAVADGALDLRVLRAPRERRGASARRRALRRGAATEFRAALALWRGPALADLAEEPCARTVAARLDELRLLGAGARDRRGPRVRARRGAGRRARRAGRAASAARALSGAADGGAVPLWPPGRRARGLPARARDARRGARHRARRGAARPAARDPRAGSGARAGARRAATVGAPIADRSASRHGRGLRARLGAVARRARRAPGRRRRSASCVVATSVAERGRARRRGAAPGASCATGCGAAGVTARTAAFTSVTPGHDLARLAAEQDVELLVVDAPDGLLEDARLLALLDDAPCDVAILVGARAAGAGAVLVPFSGSEHDWAAVELGAWLARADGRGAAARGREHRRRGGATPAGCWPTPRSPCSAGSASPPSP